MIDGNVIWSKVSGMHIKLYIPCFAMIRLTFLFVTVTTVLFAQPKHQIYKHSILQLGIFPGLSTNGLNPGEFDNDISINILSGYGHSNRIIAINGITGFNTASSTGIHLSGLADFIGGNGQVGLSDKEKRSELRSGYETSLLGFQISGVHNYVGSNVTGGQFALGGNMIKNYLIGVQLGGVYNYVGGFTMGAQLSIFANYSKKSMSGFQLAGFLNYTNGSYSGIQIAAINHAGVINSTKEPGTSQNTALQIGLINLSGNMGGTQIGLINIGKKVSGTQIGLVNIFKNGSTVDSRDRPAYGLLNIGDIINPRIYTSAFFLANYGLHTGKSLNGRVRSATRSLTSYNEVLYSTNYSINREARWGVSYKVGFISYYKSVDIRNQRNYCSLLAEVGHFNKNKKFDGHVNIRYAVHIETGFRLSKKINFVYPFLGVSYNYIPQQIVNGPEIIATNNSNGSFWLGYTFGIMLH